MRIVKKPNSAFPQTVSNISLDSCLYRFQSADNHLETTFKMSYMEPLPPGPPPAGISAMGPPPPPAPISITRHPISIDPALAIPSASNMPAPPIANSASGDTWTLERSMEEIEQASFTIRDDVSFARMSDTTTNPNYFRYVSDYDTWWLTTESQKSKNNPGYVCVPARPITAAKVAHFLNYELHRPKVSPQFP